MIFIHYFCRFFKTFTVISLKELPYCVVMSLTSLLVGLLDWGCTKTHFFSIWNQNGFCIGRILKQKYAAREGKTRGRLMRKGFYLYNYGISVP